MISSPEDSYGQDWVSYTKNSLDHRFIKYSKIRLTTYVYVMYE
jgi:hypothetical protein